MQWSTEQLEKRAKSYNRIYFNNEIEKPIHIRWSRRMYNADSKTNAYHKDLDNYHLIMLNVSYSNVSEEMMRSTLVHEMIHAWQSEPLHPDDAQLPNAYRRWFYVQYASCIADLCSFADLEMVQRTGWYCCHGEEGQGECSYSV